MQSDDSSSERTTHPMDAESVGEVTRLLRQWADGDREALGALTPIVYEQLRRLAHAELRRERDGHTLQSTALVNEAFLRLLGSDPVALQNRAHFVAVAARLMRQILVDYARARRANKRDAGLRVDLQLAEQQADPQGLEIIQIDDALRALSQHDERQARIVEMRFFGGLTSAEVAGLLGVSLTTVERDWAVARLWLRREMHGALPA